MGFNVLLCMQSYENHTKIANEREKKINDERDGGEFV